MDEVYWSDGLLVYWSYLTAEVYWSYLVDEVYWSTGLLVLPCG